MGFGLVRCYPDCSPIKKKIIKICKRGGKIQIESVMQEMEGGSDSVSRGDAILRNGKSKCFFCVNLLLIFIAK